MNGFKRLFKSMSYSLVAQMISLFVSVFMSFFVSRYMSDEGYGYYQFFLFCSTYVPLLQLGISEGVYLENGGCEYKTLDFKRLKALFFNTLILDAIIVILGGPIVILLSNDDSKKIVIAVIGLYTIANVFYSFFGMLLQAVNRIEEYSKAVIIGKLISLITFFSLIILQNYDFKWYCLSYLVGFILSGIIVSVKCKEVFCTKERMWKIILFQNKSTIRDGISLLLAGLISSFIIGVNRVYIEAFLGMAVFGKVSMALSLINFFILFAIQIGMVMFPRVAVYDDQKKERLYIKFDDYSVLVLPIILFGYIPLRYLLNHWIPQYEESIRWMLIFLPYMVYEIKTQMVYNIYIKSYREEKKLFAVNLIALLQCAIINLFIIYFVRNLEVAFWVINFVMLGKSFALSRIVEHRMRQNTITKFIVESIAVCIASFFSYYFLSALLTFTIAILYAAIGILYLSVKRKLECRQI